MKCNYCGADNPDGAAACISCRAQLSPGVAVSPKSSGLAIAALVLGILGFFTCGTTGFLAIIFGIVAMVKLSKPDSTEGGRNLAIAGLVTGGLSLVVMPLLVLPAILFPVFSRARVAAKKTQCMNNMKQLGVAYNLYYTDNGMLPSSAIRTGSSKWDADEFVDFAMYTDGKPTIYQVLSPYMKNKDIMACPTESESETGPLSVSYYYKAAVDRSWFDGRRTEADFVMPADQVTFWERNDRTHTSPSIGLADGVGIHMLFADGHVATKLITDSGYSPAEKPPTPLPNSGKGEPAWFNTAIGTTTHSVGQYYDITQYQDTFSEGPYTGYPH